MGKRDKRKRGRSSVMIIVMNMVNLSTHTKAFLFPFIFLIFEFCFQFCLSGFSSVDPQLFSFCSPRFIDFRNGRGVFFLFPNVLRFLPFSIRKKMPYKMKYRPTEMISYTWSSLVPAQNIHPQRSACPKGKKKLEKTHTLLNTGMGCYPPTHYQKLKAHRIPTIINPGCSSNILTRSAMRAIVAPSSTR